MLQQDLMSEKTDEKRTELITLILIGYDICIYLLIPNQNSLNHRMPNTIQFFIDELF